jgi:tetrahydromethanopterin S-methyltransferase subunit E
MRDRAWLDRWRLVNAVVAVGQPLLLVAVAGAAAQLGAFPAGNLAGVVRVGLLVLVGLVWLAGVVLEAPLPLLFLAAIAGVSTVMAVLRTGSWGTAVLAVTIMIALRLGGTLWLGWSRSRRHLRYTRPWW